MDNQLPDLEVLPSRRSFDIVRGSYENVSAVKASRVRRDDRGGPAGEVRGAARLEPRPAPPGMAEQE